MPIPACFTESALRRDGGRGGGSSSLACRHRLDRKPFRRSASGRISHLGEFFPCGRNFGFYFLFNRWIFRNPMSRDQDRARHRAGGTQGGSHDQRQADASASSICDRIPCGRRPEPCGCDARRRTFRLVRLCRRHGLRADRLTAYIRPNPLCCRAWARSRRGFFLCGFQRSVIGSMLESFVFSRCRNARLRQIPGRAKRDSRSSSVSMALTGALAKAKRR